MLYTTLLTLLSISVSAVTAVATFNNVVVFTPPGNYTIPKTLYARSIELRDGSILATWENYSPEPPQVFFPIFKSTDGGVTWTNFSSVQDTQNGWGLRYQPFLYVLPESFAGFAKGDILCAGSSIPTDLSITQIELYASRDNGLNWEFVSHVVRGGNATPTNGFTPVWEPFLLLHEGQLILYYSDQRDTAHGQKVSHFVSSDGLSWGDEVDDVALADYNRRPGMPVVSALPDGNWIMTYEDCNGPHGCAASYLIAESPLNFGSASPQYLQPVVGSIPSSSPYNVWTPYGGANGTIIANANSDTAIFYNKKLGAADSWIRVATNQTRGYTRQVRVTSDPQYIQLILGGTIGAKSNKVTTSVLDLSKYIA